MHGITAKHILSSSGGMNIYRGCTHGCIYCDARSECYGMDHEFEDIAVKTNAVELLESELKRKRKKCMIGTGAMSDPYLHIERSLETTRKTLELARRYGFGMTVQTKSDLVLRDLDLIKEINAQTKFVVQMTLTTADDTLCKILEPNVCPTSRRVEVLEILRDNCIPTVVWLCPILPYINDTQENVSQILDYCARAMVYGMINFGMGLTLRSGNREYFYKKLDEHFPGLKQKYITAYGNSYEIASPNNSALMRLYHSTCESYGIVHSNDKVFAYLHEFEQKPKYEQLRLF
ncbi:MAG: radical SAM protein [Clostridiales bacterium]|nr:radical SAM protein [Clostridiales bacterium]